MMAERVKLFEEVPEPDLSRFAPRTGEGQGPTLDEVRQVSTAAGFPNRDPTPISSPRVAPIIERHYYRTGRDTQFNTKVRPDVKAGYVAIAAKDGVPMGKVLEDALDALLRERKVASGAGEG